MISVVPTLAPTGRPGERTPAPPGGVRGCHGCGVGRRHRSIHRCDRGIRRSDRGIRRHHRHVGRRYGRIAWSDRGIGRRHWRIGRDHRHVCRSNRRMGVIHGSGDRPAGVGLTSPFWLSSCCNRSAYGATTRSMTWERFRARPAQRRARPGIRRDVKIRLIVTNLRVGAANWIGPRPARVRRGLRLTGQKTG